MTYSRAFKLLFISTSVAPLGSGIGGGVELTIQNITINLNKHGIIPDIVAPEGSVLKGSNLTGLSGTLQPKAQLYSRNENPATPEDAVLIKMCDYAHKNQHRYDLIINFSYDWLPIYLTPSFEVPLAHFISMSSLNDAMDFEMGRLATRFRKRMACYTFSQAATFPEPEVFTILGSGIDNTRYHFRKEPGSYIVWIGRISREKSVEDAAEVAKRTGVPLKIMGIMEDPGYWDEVISRYSETNIEYAGFKTTDEMQKITGGARALLMTPKWIEAFGMAAIEALACGVPVISYNRGGPSEIIEHGATGFLTEPGSIEGLIEALDNVDRIDRMNCRLSVEEKFSLDALDKKCQAWFQDILAEFTVH